MAVTVINNLTTLDEADATTNWATFGGASGLEANTEFQRTGTACIGAKVSNEKAGVALTITSRDMTGEHLFVWMQATNAVDPVGNGLRIHLDDGTNFDEFQVADSTTYLGGWQVFVLQCSATPTIDNGADITAITGIRFEFDTAVSVSGNISTFFVDRVSVQPSATSHAIDVTGGLTGDRGTWQEIVEHSVNDAIGVVERRSGIIVLNGGIKFGTTTAADTYFEDNDEVCIFQNHLVEDGFYNLEFVGNSGQTNSFVLGSEVGSGDDSRGTGGGTIASVGSTFDIVATDVNMNPLDLLGVVIDGAGTTQWEQTNARAISCIWTNSGSITHDNNAEMREGVISASSAVSGVGAIEFLQNPVSPDFRDMSIINCIHAIEWSQNGANTLDLRNILFAGNTADIRFNHTSGLLTVNVLLGGDTPTTSDGGGGGTILIVNAVTLTVHCERKDDNTNISGVQIIIKLVSDGSTVASGTTNASGNFIDTFDFASDTDVTIDARKSTLPIPRYFAESAANTITTNGMNQNFLMREDNIVAQA